MNARRLWQVTQLLLREAWQLRVGWIVTGLMIALVIAAAALRTLHFGGDEPRFLLGVAEFALRWGGVGLLAVAGTALLHGALESRGLALLLVRGVRRCEWLGALWLVLAVVAVAAFAACALALGVVLAASGNGAAAGPAVARLALGIGPLLVMAGAVVLAATIARTPPLALALSFAFALAGQLAPIARFAGERSEGWARVAWAALDSLIPDFSLFQAGAGPLVAVYALAASLVYLAVAAGIFSRREF
jgi:hypothetical protein